MTLFIEVKLPGAKRRSFRAVNCLGKKPVRASLARKLCLRRGLPPSAMSGFAIHPHRKIQPLAFPHRCEAGDLADQLLPLRPLQL
jgi:hypothetical protein